MGFRIASGDVGFGRTSLETLLGARILAEESSVLRTLNC